MPAVAMEWLRAGMRWMILDGGGGAAVTMYRFPWDTSKDLSAVVIPADVRKVLTAP